VRSRSTPEVGAARGSPPTRARSARLWRTSEADRMLAGRSARRASARHASPRRWRRIDPGLPRTDVRGGYGTQPACGRANAARERDRRHLHACVRLLRTGRVKGARRCAGAAAGRLRCAASVSRRDTSRQNATAAQSAAVGVRPLRRTAVLRGRRDAGGRARGQCSSSSSSSA
jgi:hypothetical protein